MTCLVDKAERFRAYSIERMSSAPTIAHKTCDRLLHVSTCTDTGHSKSAVPFCFTSSRGHLIPNVNCTRKEPTLSRQMAQRLLGFQTMQMQVTVVACVCLLLIFPYVSTSEETTSWQYATNIMVIFVVVLLAISTLAARQFCAGTCKTATEIRKKRQAKFTLRQ